MIPFTPHFSIEILGTKYITEQIFTTISFMIFSYLVLKSFQKEKIRINTKDMIIFLSGIIIFSLVGGRIWFYLSNPNYSIIDFFNLLQGGLVSWGMLVGGAIFIVIYSKILKNGKIIPEKFGDIIVIPLTLFIFIFRVGCTIDGHVKGKITKVPWGLQYAGEIFGRHPVSLYLALSSLLIFFILLIFFGKKKTEKRKYGHRFDGEIGIWFLLLYSFNRFWIEFFAFSHNNNLKENLYFGLQGRQILCIVMIIFAILLLFNRYRKIIKVKTYEQSNKIIFS